MQDGRRNVVTDERPETNVKCDGNVKGNMDASGDKASGLSLNQRFHNFGCMTTRESCFTRGGADSFISLLTRTIRVRFPVFESLARSRKCKHIDRCWQDGKWRGQNKISRWVKRGRCLCYWISPFKEHSHYANVKRPWKLFVKQEKWKGNVLCKTVHSKQLSS